MANSFWQRENYITWIWHGELTDMKRGSQSEPFDVEMGDHLEDMIRYLGQESFQQAHAPMDECKVMISRFDLNGDGMLSFEEFKIMKKSL